MAENPRKKRRLNPVNVKKAKAVTPATPATTAKTTTAAAKEEGKREPLTEMQLFGYLMLSPSHFAEDRYIGNLKSLKEGDLVEYCAYLLKDAERPVYSMKPCERFIANVECVSDNSIRLTPYHRIGIPDVPLCVPPNEGERGLKIMRRLRPYGNATTPGIQSGGKMMEILENKRCKYCKKGIKEWENPKGKDEKKTQKSLNSRKEVVHQYTLTTAFKSRSDGSRMKVLEHPLLCWSASGSNHVKLVRQNNKKKKGLFILPVTTTTPSTHEYQVWAYIWKHVAAIQDSFKNRNAFGVVSDVSVEFHRERKYDAEGNTLFPGESD